jgi:hypothetical protein
VLHSQSRLGSRFRGSDELGKGRAERPGNVVRLNVTLDEGFGPTVLSWSEAKLSRSDNGRVAENRSGLLAEATLEYLGRLRERQFETTERQSGQQSQIIGWS